MSSFDGHEKITEESIKEGPILPSNLQVTSDSFS